MIRKVAYQAINISVITSQDNLFKRKYRQIIAQSNTKDARQKAKVKLCAKFLRIVFAVLSKKEPFRESLADPS